MSELVKRKLNKRDATRLNKQIKSKIDELESLIVEFIDGEGWLSLGYETAWEWWTTEVGQQRLGTATGEKVILQFKEEGISNRQIAPAIGKDISNVGRTVTRLVANATPEPVTSPDDIIDAEIIHEVINEQNRRVPTQAPQDDAHDAAQWIPALIEAINADLDALADWQEISDEITNNQLREELDILKDKIQRIEAKL